MLAKTTLDAEVQVRLAKGEIRFRHKRIWHSKKLEAYFVAMLAPAGVRPIVVVPQRFFGDWFVVQVQPSQEKAVAAALIGRGFPCYLPMRLRKVRGQNAHHHVKVERAMLPGYVLASFGFAEVSRITNTAGVVDVLGCEVELASGLIQRRPVPIPIALMYRLRDKEAELANGARVLRIDDQQLKIGDAVQVADGPFTSFLGVVVELFFDRHEVKVEIDIFGRKTPVTLDVEQLTVI